MANNLPLKLTMAQTQRMKRTLDELPDVLAKEEGVNRDEAHKELAIICARYAFNAGVLDQHRLPPEAQETPHVDPPQPDHAGPDQGGVRAAVAGDPPAPEPTAAPRPRRSI